MRANSIFVRGDAKLTRPVLSNIFMITGGRIPSIKEMTTDDYGSKLMHDIDPDILKISSKMWEKKGLMQMGRFIERT
jgi:hypothetical protein